MDPIFDALDRQGFDFVHAAEMRALLEAAGPLSDWPRFAASWDALDLDTYMADGGRYRRRRHAHFAAPAGEAAIRRQPHRPHFQAIDYNPLNGGVERWFAPIEPAIGDSASLTAILRVCRGLFDRLSPGKSWAIELHQFRIEARVAEAGQPTPEGMHRDGVDWVLVLLIARQNIRSGETTIHDLDHRQLGSFTLTEPLDAAFVHDTRVYHGVTPVEPIDPTRPAHRDVLVVTFRAEAG